MSDSIQLITFIRDQIDGDPILLSTITNNTDKDEYRKLIEAYETYMRKYGKDYEKGTVRNDTEDFLKITNAVQAFKKIAQDEADDSYNINVEEDLNDLILKPTPINTPKPNKQKSILPSSKSMIRTPIKFTVTTPTKKPSIKSQSFMDEEFNDFKLPSDKIVKDDSDDTKINPRKKSTGVRENKTLETVKDRLKDDYTFENPKFTDISTYRNNLWDILINGNYRVKFSPKCATRKGATEYCSKKFDENGYPLYRLLPVNSKDYFGNNICDLNGDRVDDVVIVDKRGNPIIVNGYKLLKASPYKKLWNEERANNPDIEPFNIWMQKKLELTRTWDYDEKTWKSGQLEFDIDKIQDKNMKKAYRKYNELGLGKPHVSKRITARGLWASIFNKIWELALDSLFKSEDFSFVVPLKKIFNYMKVCNAVFMTEYEIQIMQKHDCDGKWMKWVNYKSTHSKEVNAELGMLIQNDYTENLAESIPIGGSIAQNLNLDSGRLFNIVGTTIYFIQKGLGYNERQNDNGETINNIEALKEIATNMESNVYTKKDIDNYKEVFKYNIDVELSSFVGSNYLDYKNKIKKDKKTNASKSYINYKQFHAISSDDEE